LEHFQYMEGQRLEIFCRDMETQPHFCILWHKSRYTRVVVEQQAYTHLAKNLGSVYVEKYIFLAMDLSKGG
jgi:hypothetical protein